MSETVQIAIKTGLAALAATLLLLDRPGLGVRALAWLRHLLVAAAVLAVGAYFNFGTFHGGGLFPHQWEQFHYFLGSKYFPELGYDGLYVASMGAEMQFFRQRAHQPFLRDLRTNAVVPTASLAAHGYSVRQRFSDERWREFARDNAFYLGLDPAYFLRVRTDHGYNPSPAWTFIARLVDSDLGASRGTAVLLGVIDLLLLGLTFAVFFRSYGAEMGLLALVVFATGYGWRWYWTGGAFLRQDWLAASMLAFCMLKRERFRLAGALLAYAAMVRVFPVLFLAGPAVQAARDLVLRRDVRWARRLLTGFLLGAAALFCLGAATGRGFAAWTEFAQDLRKHNDTWLTNNVGLKDVVLYDTGTYERRLVHWELPEPWLHWQAYMDARQQALRPLLWGLAAALSALALWTARRGRPDEAAASGLVLVFALSALTCYYWGMLVLALVRRPRLTAVGLLTIDVAMGIVHFESGTFEIRYGLMSWMLLLFFLAWMLSDLLPRPEEIDETSIAPAAGRRAADRSLASRRPQRRRTVRRAARAVASGARCSPP